MRILKVIEKVYAIYRMNLFYMSTKKFHQPHVRL